MADSDAGKNTSSGPSTKKKPSGKGTTAKPGPKAKGTGQREDPNTTPKKRGRKEDHQEGIADSAKPKPRISKGKEEVSSKVKRVFKKPVVYQVYQAQQARNEDKQTKGYFP